MQTLNFGIIGCGIISQSHFQAVQAVSGAQVVAAADINQKALAARTEQFNVARGYADWNELLRDDEVQAVSICLPHHLHLPAALDAARAGKHLLIEKPFAISLDEVDQIIAAAQENKVTLMIAQVLRRYPVNKLAKQLIQEGRIGRVASIQRRRIGDGSGNLAQYGWAAKPEVSGGWLLYGFGPHEYDTILWLLDTQVKTLGAMGVRNKSVWNDYDEITAIMTLQNGAMATMVQSLNSAVSAWDCIIIGDSGTIFTKGNELICNGETMSAPVDGAAAFAEQVQEFVESVQQNREPDTSGRCVRPTMVALEAVQQSLATGDMINVSDW